MVVTTIWVTTAISGRLRRAIVSVPGVGSCITVIQRSTVTITLRTTVLLLGF